MKLKTISDKYNTYLKKIGRKKYESVSQYYFYGDHPNEGFNQCIYYTKHVYDSIFGETDLMEICKDLTAKGWKNIVIERYKNYYEKMKSCPVMNQKSICVNKYRVLI